MIVHPSTASSARISVASREQTAGLEGHLFVVHLIRCVKTVA